MLGRRGAGVAATVAVALVVGGTAWVVTGRDTGPDRPPGTSKGWDGEALRVWLEINGSYGERQAAAVVNAYAQNRAYTDCLAGKGFRQRWQWEIVPTGPDEDPLLVTFWAAARQDGLYTGKLETAEIQKRLQRAKARESGKPGLLAAQTACLPSWSGEGRTGRPAQQTELLQAWNTALEPVFLAGGGLETYETCVAGTGVLRRLGVRSSAEARTAVQPSFRVWTVPLGTERPSARWQAFQRREQAWVDADWQCRRETRDRVAHLVGPAVERFEAAHADELRAARQHWETMTRQAAQVGWSPEDPFAGVRVPDAP